MILKTSILCFLTSSVESGTLTKIIELSQAQKDNILNQHNSSNTFAYLAAHYTLNILHKPSKLNERSDR